MMHALRLYGRYASISLRAQLEYRASMLMQAAGQCLVTGMEFIGIWALFSRFGEIRGWALEEVAFFYGLISVTWALADAVARGFDIFGNTVKYGERLVVNDARSARAAIAPVTRRSAGPSPSLSNAMGVPSFDITLFIEFSTSSFLR